MNWVFNTNIVFYPSIGLVLLLYYIEEFSTIMILVLYCMQKASIDHHCGRESQAVHGHRARQVGNSEGALCGEEHIPETTVERREKKRRGPSRLG